MVSSAPVATPEKCKYCNESGPFITCFSCRETVGPKHVDPESRIHKRCLPDKYMPCPQNPVAQAGLYGHEYETQDTFLPGLVNAGMQIAAWIVLLAIIGGLFYAATMNNITESSALQRFKEIAGTNNVTIVRSSNPDMFTGDPHNVRFELLVDGHRYNGLCTSGAFSPQVCELHPV